MKAQRTLHEIDEKLPDTLNESIELKGFFVFLVFALDSRMLLKHNDGLH